MRVASQLSFLTPGEPLGMVPGPSLTSPLMPPPWPPKHKVAKEAISPVGIADIWLLG